MVSKRKIKEVNKVLNVEHPELEIPLKKIKDAELDIELLKRNNEVVCTHNNYKIGELEVVIKETEEALESELKKSKKDKLECKLGSVSWRQMPDEWKYQDEILMAWIISLPAIFKNLFLKVITTINKADLKRQIMIENAEIFEKRKITDPSAKLYLRSETKDYLVEGIEIKSQKPKFHYTIKNLKK